MGVYPASTQPQMQVMPGQYAPQVYYPSQYPTPHQEPPVQGMAPIAATVVYPSINVPRIGPAGMNNTQNLYGMQHSQPQSTTPYVHGLQQMDGQKRVQDSETAI